MSQKNPADRKDLSPDEAEHATETPPILSLSTSLVQLVATIIAKSVILLSRIYKHLLVL